MAPASQLLARQAALPVLTPEKRLISTSVGLQQQMPWQRQQAARFITLQVSLLKCEMLKLGIVWGVGCMPADLSCPPLQDSLRLSNIPNACMTNISSADLHSLKDNATLPPHH